MLLRSWAANLRRGLFLSRFANVARGSPLRRARAGLVGGSGPTAVRKESFLCLSSPYPSARVAHVPVHLYASSHGHPWDVYSTRSPYATNLIGLKAGDIGLCNRVGTEQTKNAEINEERKCQTNRNPRRLMQIGGANAIAYFVKLGTTDIAPIPGVEGQKRMTKRRSRAPSLANVSSCGAAFAPTAGTEI